MKRWPSRAVRGFSLVEILVAFSIMAVSLALLYRVMGGSVDTVSRVVGQQQAIMLAQSLLKSQEFVGPAGWAESGESAGLRWRVESRLHHASVATRPEMVRLHEVTLRIQWGSQAANSLEVSTLRPQRKAWPGESLP